MFAKTSSAVHNRWPVYHWQPSSILGELTPTSGTLLIYLLVNSEAIGGWSLLANLQHNRDGFDGRPVSAVSSSC